MVARRLNRVTAALVIVALALQVPAWARVTANEGADTDRADVAEAIRFRSTYGFRSDVDYVTRAAGDAVGFPDMEFGVPLTTVEAAEILRRGEIQLQLGAASQLVVPTPEYAGLYLDQLDGGKPVFLFAGDPEKYRADIEKALPDGTAFRLGRVGRSYEELRSLRDRIEDDRNALRALGADVVLTGFPVVDNTVLVGVSGLTAASEELLRLRYGAAISIRDEPDAFADTCSFTACTPMKGGVRVLASDGGTCTAAFLAKRDGSSIYAAVTAGHCLAVHGGYGKAWTHSSVNMTSRNNTWTDGSIADVGILDITSADVPIDKNDFLSVPPTDIRNLTSVEASVNRHVAESVCRTGITSGKDCGTIFAENVERDSCVPGWGCMSIRETMEVNFDSTKGDSGGPYYWIERGYGIHVDSQADSSSAHGWYSTLGDASSQYWARFGVTYRFCLNAGCTVLYP